jgi:hypothetical protein
MCTGQIMELVHESVDERMVGAEGLLGTRCSLLF